MTMMTMMVLMMIMMMKSCRYRKSELVFFPRKAAFLSWMEMTVKGCIVTNPCASIPVQVKSFCSKRVFSCKDVHANRAWCVLSWRANLMYVFAFTGVNQYVCCNRHLLMVPQACIWIELCVNIPWPCTNTDSCYTSIEAVHPYAEETVQPTIFVAVEVPK
jgi:hypothetical protein